MCVRLDNIDGLLHLIDTYRRQPVSRKLGMVSPTHTRQYILRAVLWVEG
jgi:hypothetical protein